MDYINTFEDNAPTTEVKPERMSFFEFESTKKYFTVIMNNTAGVTLPFNLFDQSNLTDPFYADPKNITSDTSKSYLAIVREMIDNGYQMEWVKLRAVPLFGSVYTADDQMKQPFSRNYIDSSGQIDTKYFILPTYLDIFQQQTDYLNVDLRKEPVLIDGKTYFTLNILGNMQVMAIFFWNRALRSDILEKRLLD